MEPPGAIMLSEGANLARWTHIPVVQRAVARNNVLSVLTNGLQPREFVKTVCNAGVTKVIDFTRDEHLCYDRYQVLKGTGCSALTKKFAQAISAHSHPVHRTDGVAMCGDLRPALLSASKSASGVLIIKP